MVRGLPSAEMRRVLFAPVASSATAVAAAAASQRAGQLRWFVLVQPGGGVGGGGGGSSGGRGRDPYSDSQSYLQKAACERLRGTSGAPELTLFRAVAPKRLPFVGFASDLEDAAERLAKAGRLPEDGGQLRAVRKLQTRRVKVLLHARRVEEKAAIREWVAAGGRGGGGGDGDDDDDGYMYDDEQAEAMAALAASAEAAAAVEAAAAFGARPRTNSTAVAAAAAAAACGSRNDKGEGRCGGGGTRGGAPTRRRWVERGGVVRARSQEEEQRFKVGAGGGPAAGATTNWLNLQPDQRYSYEVLDRRGRRVHLGVSFASEKDERQRLQRRGVLKGGFTFRRVQNDNLGPGEKLGA